MKKRVRHLKNKLMYIKTATGLFQNEKGEWVDCVVYTRMGMTFVRLKEDFNKSFLEV